MEDLAQPESVRRLDALNRDGYDVYCTVNTVHPEATGRTKADIASVRRLQLDLDEVSAENDERVMDLNPQVAFSSGQGRRHERVVHVDLNFDLF